jgi:hypothetical protein
MRKDAAQVDVIKGKRLERARLDAVHDIETER